MFKRMDVKRGHAAEGANGAVAGAFWTLRWIIPSIPPECICIHRRGWNPCLNSPSVRLPLFALLWVNPIVK